MAKIPSTTSSAEPRRIPFKYCVRDIDRHGNERLYVRLPGMPKYRMKAIYLDETGSSVTKEFTEEYHRTCGGTEIVEAARPDCRAWNHPLACRELF